MKKMKKILVTGGSGFVGSHVCEKLLSLGHEVFCLDNFFTGNKSNISHLVSNENFEIIRHDIIHSFFIEVDEIYNLACPASPPQYQYNPIKTMKTSVLGSINMLGLAKRVKAKILQASTSEIYGDPEVHPQTESYFGNVNPIGVRSCYDEGKRCAETLFMDYHTENNVKIKIIRIFNTYGPNMNPNDGRVVSNFIMQALQGKDITLYGDGSQTRSFQYIDDLVDGLIKMMDSKDDIIGPFNMGNPNEISMITLAETILKLTQSNSKLVFEPLPKDDPKRRKPDITLAKQILNWEPNIKLETGLLKTIDYFKTFC